jgi:HlyD family secretion protein
MNIQARAPIVPALIALAGLAGCDVDPAALPLVGTLERDRLELTAEAREEIVEVLVTEGERVTQGQLLMRLERSRQQADVAAAAAERERAAQRVAELVRGTREESIREAEARLEGARRNLAIQVTEHDRIEKLVDRALASAADLDRALNARENASAQVAELAAVLDRLLDGVTAEELAQARADLAAAEARLEAQKIVAGRLDIVAPRDGAIDALPYKLGERPPAGAAAVIMLADQAPYARVYVPEPLKARVDTGLAATVTVDGLDGTFAGRVRYVSADAAFTPYYSLTQRDRSRLAFLAEVTLTDDAARTLPSGVSVQVDFPALHIK